MIHQNWKELTKKQLCSTINPDFIVVFGSYAKGKTHKDSDLDIAYFAKKGISHYERFLIAQQLADQLKVEVDLVDIKQVDTVFAAQIFYTGVLISCKDEDQFIQQRMKALSMYATLNEQRANLLKEIEERGYIYEE